MPRYKMIQKEEAEGFTLELLQKTEAQLGRVPNLYKSMANSPAALDGYLSFRAALSKGKLSNVIKEYIAFYVAAENGCHYCVSAHAFRGKKIGIAEVDLRLAIDADSKDLKIKAALQFVQKVIATKGKIADQDLQLIKNEGWSNEEIGEIIGHISLNIFSNYFNHVALPDLDFPSASFNHE